MLRIRQADRGQRVRPGADHGGDRAKSDRRRAGIRELRTKNRPRSSRKLPRAWRSRPSRPRPPRTTRRSLSALANKALELCNNASYVPKTLRDEAKLTNVRDALERVERRQQSQFALAEGLKAMEQAIADGKPIESYAAHMKLLQGAPGAGRRSRVWATRSRKRPPPSRPPSDSSPSRKPAETAERPTPWVAALAVANRRATAHGPRRRRHGLRARRRRRLRPGSSHRPAPLAALRRLRIRRLANADRRRRHSRRHRAARTAAARCRHRQAAVAANYRRAVRRAAPRRRSRLCRSRLGPAIRPRSRNPAHAPAICNARSRCVSRRPSIARKRTCTWPAIARACIPSRCPI